MYRHNAGCSYKARNRSDVAGKIEIEIVVECRVDCVSGTNQEKRVAIRRRAYDRLSADIAVRAGPVLDDELLTEPLCEPLTHQPCGDVVPATGGVSNYPAQRPSRIGLRPCDTRHRRQRGSGGGQMQKLPTVGKVSFRPLLQLSALRLFAQHGEPTIVHLFAQSVGPR